MKSKNLLMFVVLSAAIVTALIATTGTSLITTVYADKKHCDNEDNNCNHTENNQKLSSKDECDNKNTIKHQSDDNDIDNILICTIDATNLRDSVLLNSNVFGDIVAPEFQ